jgi:hypothetical protein
MFLVIARVPKGPNVAALAARATGLAMADVSMRLAGILPRVLHTDASHERLETLAAALEGAGFVTLVVDPAHTPDDSERVRVRRLELRADGLTAFDGAEQAYDCPTTAVALVQRGVRATTHEEEERVVKKKLSLGRALATGGMVVRKKVETVVTHASETREAFLLVQRSDGGAELILYERALHYQFLGAAMQPASFANLQATQARLTQLAPAARIDDRVARPGFVTGLPASSADPVDLGLQLVWLAYLRGA